MQVFTGLYLCYKASCGVWDSYRSLTLSVICRNPLRNGRLYVWALSLSSTCSCPLLSVVYTWTPTGKCAMFVNTRGAYAKPSQLDDDWVLCCVCLYVNTCLENSNRSSWFQTLTNYCGFCFFVSFLCYPTQIHLWCCGIWCSFYEPHSDCPFFFGCLKECDLAPTSCVPPWLVMPVVYS